MLSTAKKRDLHEDCDLYDNCGEACPRERERRARDAARAKLQAPQWSKLQPPAREGEAWTLDGERINCNSALELQTIQTGADDYGEFTVYRPEGVLVRYELGWRGAERVPVLYASVGGHLVELPVDACMRFRWPEGGR